MSDLLKAIANLQGFAVPSLTGRIASLESALAGADADSCRAVLSRESVSDDLLAGAYLLKRATAEINTAIHALGIVVALPHILQPGERVEYLSLGAGNTGRAFDLETTHRVAEFKFIDWRGSSETIRQNALFKDFFLLAEYPTSKIKSIYVTGKEYPLKFLRSKRTLASVMSRNVKLWEVFQTRYGDKFTTVGEYYADKQGEVRVEDVSGLFGVAVPPAAVMS